ncbi:TIGR01621 family pseudouridine synthase [Aggregatibacter kilianii]|uniref:TIGR01621 family pseudouridine synthase n=1 Tax=Aggregatibacter kilianii TaxID=2025884 RepID=UPI000D65DC93|nr:TIGR01621 family pseudouridine synthase [Aggregatibacter kilianii]
MAFQIIFQHPDFIVINKPHGISVHKDDADVGLTQWVAQQLGVPKVWLVHRLDKVTSGLLMLALNEQAAVTLSQKFAQHQIQKTYIALAIHKPKKKQGRISGDMQKARRGAWKLTQSKENPAVTDFISHSLAPNLRLFILHPKTGKTHQLRVAMKSLGSPILGDELYGGDHADRTYLHAYRLSFDYFGQTVQIRGEPIQDEQKCGDFFQRFWEDIETYANAEKNT